MELLSPLPLYVMAWYFVKHRGTCTFASAKYRGEWLVSRSGRISFMERLVSGKIPMPLPEIEPSPVIDKRF
jgi:hypothetical protein